MRWRPKRFNPPKSRRAREAADYERLGITRSDITYRIIRNLWPAGYTLDPPAWAKTAYKFGWISTPEYYSLEWHKVPGPDMFAFLYEESPFLKMLPKSADFVGKAAAA